MNAQSYCLHAGTHGPSKGEGYVLAPLLGPKQVAVAAILMKSGWHPEIAQHDILVLIWGILARSKVSEIVRYFPSGYPRTKVQVYVPPPTAGQAPRTGGGADPHCAFAVAEFDPSQDVAVPANTSSQRLSQSARGQDGWVPASTEMLNCSP